jgi:uncharacterized membrane protein
MSPLQFILTYFATIPAFIIIDALWLGTMAPRFYQTHIGHLLASSVQWAPAVIFYLLYIGGIVLFAVKPALHANSCVTALTLGALLGILAYGTYDLTNHATMKDWPLIVTVVDIIWGAVLTGSVALVSYLIATKWIV